jgi:hypothetical protein
MCSLEAVNRFCHYVGKSVNLNLKAVIRCKGYSSMTCSLLYCDIRKWTETIDIPCMLSVYYAIRHCVSPMAVRNKTASERVSISV